MASTNTQLGATDKALEVEGRTAGFFSRDFGLPHRDSGDGKSIEYPMTISRGIVEAADGTLRSASPGQVYEVTSEQMEREQRRTIEGLAHIVGTATPHVNAALEKEVAGNNSRTDASKSKGFWLIPQLPLAELARVYDIGARKYEPRGWEKGMPFSEIIDGMYRHLGRRVAGEIYDPEDSQHHMAAVAWRAFAIMEYERTHPEMDDLHGSA